MKYYVKVCPVCGETFSSDHPNSVYCSKPCNKLNRRRRFLIRYSQEFRMQNWPELEKVIEPEKAFFGKTSAIEQFSDDEARKA